jgi:hypothetical protein
MLLMKAFANALRDTEAPLPTSGYRSISQSVWGGGVVDTTPVLTLCFG